MESIAHYFLKIAKIEVAGMLFYSSKVLIPRTPSNRVMGEGRARALVSLSVTLFLSAFLIAGFAIFVVPMLLFNFSKYIPIVLLGTALLVFFIFSERCVKRILRRNFFIIDMEAEDHHRLRLLGESEARRELIRSGEDGLKNKIKKY